MDESKAASSLVKPQNPPIDSQEKAPSNHSDLLLSIKDPSTYDIAQPFLWQRDAQQVLKESKPQEEVEQARSRDDMYNEYGIDFNKMTPEDVKGLSCMNLFTVTHYATNLSSSDWVGVDCIQKTHIIEKLLAILDRLDVPNELEANTPIKVSLAKAQIWGNVADLYEEKSNCSKLIGAIRKQIEVLETEHKYLALSQMKPIQDFNVVAVRIYAAACERLADLVGLQGSLIEGKGLADATTQALEYYSAAINLQKAIFHKEETKRNDSIASTWSMDVHKRIRDSIAEHNMHIKVLSCKSASLHIRQMAEQMLAKRSLSEVSKNVLNLLLESYKPILGDRKPEDIIRKHKVNEKQCYADLMLGSVIKHILDGQASLGDVDSFGCVETISKYEEKSAPHHGSFDAMYTYWTQGLALYLMGSNEEVGMKVKLALDCSRFGAHLLKPAHALTEIKIHELAVLAGQAAMSCDEGVELSRLISK